MAVKQVVIDTKGTAYKAQLKNLQDAMKYFEPMLEIYVKLPSEKQDLWKLKDPFLDLLVKTLEKVGKR